MNTLTPPKTHSPRCHAFVGAFNECVCDGYHTFNELNEHRHELYIALCKSLLCVDVGRPYVWRAKYHSDGTEYEGWFILGINQEKGKQITYHLPVHFWDSTDFATDLGRAPEYDGHSSEDVINRIKKL